MVEDGSMTLRNANLVHFAGIKSHSCGLAAGFLALQAALSHPWIVQARKPDADPWMQWFLLCFSVDPVVAEPRMTYARRKNSRTGLRQSPQDPRSLKLRARARENMGKEVSEGCRCTAEFTGPGPQGCPF